MDRPLKQRLVGATILIALAIIFLPMLLDGSGQRDGHTPIVEIPERPDVEFQKRRLPIGDTARNQAPAPEPVPPPVTAEPESQDQVPAGLAGQESDAAVISPPEESATAGDESTNPGNQAVAEAVPETPDSQQDAPVSDEPAAIAETTDEAAAQEDSPTAQGRPAEQVSSPAPASEGGWYVQLGSFANGDNAQRLKGQLDARDIPNRLDTLPGADGTLYRVRAGPWASETEAASMLASLQNDIPGIQPRLAHDGGGAAAPRPERQPGYAVQVGGFSSAANADKLVGQIEALGISAFRERVEGSSGVIIKVKAGPVASEEEAQGLLRRIEQGTGITGLVVRQP